MNIDQWNEKEKNLEKDYEDIIEDVFNKDKVSLNQFFSFSSSKPMGEYNPKDQDMNQHYDVVFSGCSETLGEWISSPTVPDGDYLKIWGFQVADKLNLGKPLNLGMGGFSAHAILKDLVNHCINNGNPKAIFVLLPDFGRFPHVVNKKISSKSSINSVDYIKHFYLGKSDEYDFPPISKSPHEATEVLSYKQSIYINLQSIILFEQFCKSNNIYFKYSSWDYLANIILKGAKEKYPNLYNGYVEGDFKNWHNWSSSMSKWRRTAPYHHPSMENCHLDLKLDTKSGIFDMGLDGMHMGVHRHTHIAENFIMEYSNDHLYN